MKINSTKSTKLIIGFILWSIIIATPQFTYHYTNGLLNGKLQIGEMPIELYSGLVSGLFAALIVWGASILLASLISTISNKSLKGSSLFLFISLFFFTLMIITHGKNVYYALTLEGTKVKEARELIKDYNSK